VSSLIRRGHINWELPRVQQSHRKLVNERFRHESSWPNNYVEGTRDTVNRQSLKKNKTVKWMKSFYRAAHIKYGHSSRKKTQSAKRIGKRTGKQETVLGGGGWGFGITKRIQRRADLERSCWI